MHGIDGRLGVMGNPNAAMRDPLFYRWHKVEINDFLEFLLILFFSIILK